MNYSDMTFEYLLSRCLNRVSNDIDKREGSVIYNALAPACAELAEAYGVMSIPTLYVVRDGKAVGKTMGALPKAQLLAFMEQ